ncbi:MAG: permease-like cell division protein FtsX [Bacteroidales bacterium]
MKNKRSRISFFKSNITPIISVALVLLLLGVVALLALGTRTLTNQIKENVGFVVVVNSEVTADEISKFAKKLEGEHYLSELTYTSKEEALKIWERETGENLIDIFGVNPLNAEFSIKMKAEYAQVDSIDAIVKVLGYNNKMVESIHVQRDLVESIDSNINKAVLLLSAIAVLLIIISIALINNTVILGVYSRRFLIHTMKLVGATPGFIRKPFIRSNILNGFIASILAVMILSGAIYYAYTLDSIVSQVLDLPTIGIVFGGIFVVGFMICSIAAYFAASKYIRLDQDELYKR